jgi:hypothetical protein
MRMLLSQTPEHAVVVAGGGLTRLMLAGELALARVELVDPGGQYALEVVLPQPGADAVLSGSAAGIEFPGWDPTTSHLIAEVEMAGEPEWGLRRDALGIHSLSRMGMGVR